MAHKNKLCGGGCGINGDYIKPEIEIIGNAVIQLEQGLKRLDLLELEILAIKAGFRQQEEAIRLATSKICGYITGAGISTLFSQSSDLPSKSTEIRHISSELPLKSSDNQSKQDT